MGNVFSSSSIRSFFAPKQIQMGSYFTHRCHMLPSMEYLWVKKCGTKNKCLENWKTIYFIVFLNHEEDKFINICLETQIYIFSLNILYKWLYSASLS